MAEAMSWSDFTSCAQELLNISADLMDGWEWIEMSGKTAPGESYLRKKERKVLQDDSASSLLSWEYHVLYSPSYSCPVLYFNVYDSDGKFVGLDKVVQLLRFPPDVDVGLDNYLSVVSQTEHPLLRKPFCYLHPCHSPDLLAAQNKRANVLIGWLSCVAPVVRLDIHLGYAKSAV